jgi:hypothetical protein
LVERDVELLTNHRCGSNWEVANYRLGVRFAPAAEPLDVLVFLPKKYRALALGHGGFVFAEGFPGQRRRQMQIVKCK